MLNWISIVFNVNEKTPSFEDIKQGPIHSQWMSEIFLH